MFGKFAYGFENMNSPSESITKKLSEPNTTLEDLLKDETLLQEMKNQNKDLIKFFNKDRIKEMLNYITKEQEDEPDKGYKFPYICSQIFGLEIDGIMKYFFLTNKQMEEQENKEKIVQENKEENKEGSENKEDNSKVDEEQNKEEKKEEPSNEENKKEEEKKEESIKDGDKNEEKKEETIQEEEKKEEPIKEEEKKEDKKEEEEKKEDKKEEEKKEEPIKEEDNKEEPKKEGEEEKKQEEEKPKENEDEKPTEENNEENGEENQSENESEAKSETENLENKIELVDYLFTNFFPEDDSVKLNYVLSGYFSSLINNLLSINPLSFLKYMYLERSEYFNKMVDHSYRKSISDTLSKLLHFENYLQNNEPLDDKIKEDMCDTRKYLLSDIFEKIDIDMENEDLNSIYFFITGLFDITNLNEEKPIFEEIINNKKIIKSIITKPFHDLDLISYDNNSEEDYIKILNRRNNFATLIEMILFFLKNIKKLKLEIPTNTSESKLTIKHTKISDEIFIILKSLLQNNFIKKNDNEKAQLQCFNDYQLKPLGEFKIKIIELLTHLVSYFKNISKFYDEILIEVDFFKVAIEFLLEYEWNNLYQESLLNLFKTLFDHADEHQTVQKHLIETIKIFDLIQTHTNLDSLEKFTFIKTQDNNLAEEERETLPIKRGYYSFFISLSYKLNTVMGGTPVNIEGGIPRQGSFAFMKRVPEEGDKKAALDMLYGGFMDEPEEKNEKEEEEQFSYECMKEFINDQWREFFGMNIESVIKQYEDKNWPKQEKKPFQSAMDGFYNETDKEVDLLNANNEEISDRDKNLFGDNDDAFGNAEEDKGRRGGVYEGNDDDTKNPFYDAVRDDNFDFGDEKEKEIKDNNNFSNENDFDFGDDSDNARKKEKNEEENKEINNEENKDEIKGENKEENIEENKEENKEEKKEENKIENDEQNKVENKDEIQEKDKEDIKENNKEENKEENKEQQNEDKETKKDEIKEENKEENKEEKKDENKVE